MPRRRLKKNRSNTESTAATHLAHLPKDAKDAVAAELDYILSAQLGDTHAPLLMSVAHGKGFKSVESKLSSIFHCTIAAGLTFDAQAIWADSSTIGMSGLSTLCRVIGAAARADAHKIADFISLSGGVVKESSESYAPPTMDWSISGVSDVTHVLAVSLAMTKCAVDSFNEAWKLATDAGFAAGAAFCAAGAAAQMEVARSKASLVCSAKACIGDPVGLKEFDRVLLKEANVLAAAASAESVLPLRFLLSAPVRERAAEMAEAGAPYMCAAHSKPVLLKSLMG